MRVEINTTYTRVYQFAELSENAKKEALEEYVNDANNIWFQYEWLEDDFSYRFRELFPKNSKYLIKQWDNSYCQSRGLEVDFEFDLLDFIPIYGKDCEILEKFIEKTIEWTCIEFEAYISDSGIGSTLPFNLIILFNSELKTCQNIPSEFYEFAMWYNNLLCEFLTEMWNNSENMINPDIDSPDFRADFEDLCEANQWEFLENGTMYQKTC